MNKQYVLLLFIPLLFAACVKEKADLIIHNATIYTVDDAFSKAQAIAISGDSILAVGPEHEILNKYSADQLIDARKSFVYPGFIDAHCHFYGYGLSLQHVNLVGTRSFKEVAERAISHKNKITMGWITGRGWDQNDWEIKQFPDRQLLDSILPDIPVFLKRIDGHAAIANQAALEKAGITTTTEIDGGIIEKINGRLTGVLIDNAMGLVEKIIPEPNRELQIKALKEAEKNCLQVGLTTVDDAGLNKRVIDLIHELHQNGELKIKVYAMANPSQENLNFYLENGPIKTDRLTVCSFKVYADGALGSRGAKLLEPYSDAPGQTGLLISSPAYYMELAERIYNAGFQMNTHAIGDSANRLMLNTYAHYLNGINDRRWRIEHAQIVNENDFHIFSENTIIPSVQPTHATSDMYWAVDRIGHQRAQNAYAYKKLLNLNGILALGTDFPIEDIDPLKTFYAAVSRKDTSGYPEKGFFPEQALKRENVLRGMTIWAAISNFEEKSKGSLEPGKKADIIILDRDIMTVKDELIIGTKVKYSFINGKIAYARN